MRKNIIRLISRQVWKQSLQNKGILFLLVLLSCLFVFAAYTGWKNYSVQEEIRTEHQQEVRQQWESKPDKHPHRMAHYGYLIFRPRYPLSFFDSGLERYTGNSVFLEAHKQNTANFSEAGFSSGMLRFGEISIAMVLQILVPLFIFFLGFSCISAERENNTLKILLSQGVKWKELLTGKMLGLLSLVSLLYFPVIIVSVMLWLSLAGFKVSIDEVTRLLWIILSYFGYFFIISLVCVLVSATSKTSKSSLIKLISIWLLFIVIMPRAAQAFGSYTHPAPSKIDFDTRVESELIKAGDSHNPDDIHYKGIKDSLLKTYKVATVEELPFNYSGYIMAEGEKLSAGIYNKYWNEQLNIYEKQNNISTYLSFINPFLAIRNLSMALTGSDFNSYVSYQKQVEEYRYKLAQLMNKLQMENISNKKQGATDKPYTISKDHWKEMPDFSYRFIGQKDLFRNEISAILSLIIWGAGLLFLIHFMSKKIKIY
ncbi:ABC transporter permease [Elizabethkingia anophelis]|uniref:ABC transporter permease n=1 Tax=Elizabethkingia anophelis R26 TaxID=1246994 RepID=A0ABM6MQ60_9FLAO|nr:MULTISPECIES: DUF3526 domain-containing protein [Elizabethkingia]ATC35193.1 ABC transporter permease [Elizabethkingia anophelis R26]ATC38833.1 ABC transporter permease [Elizabethkingia anophelis Ag1]ATC42513.1 ABC transporter permease [Elizabethkingia anophelis]ATC46189.1 ABC transporter permease [Elizabethkingia anophelis]AVF48882.1 DUF3526 domain-containing protein [Elizabethkingia anophelis]